MTQEKRFFICTLKFDLLSSVLGSFIHDGNFQHLKKHPINKIKFDLSIFIIRTLCNTMSSKLGLTIIFQKEYLLRKIKENDLD